VIDTLKKQEQPAGLLRSKLNAQVEWRE